jgi:hypothetical protein
MVRFIGVSKQFWSPEAMHYIFLPAFIIEWKATFQFEVSENKVVIFSSPKVTDPQVKNGWSRPVHFNIILVCVKIIKGASSFQV